MTGQGIDFSGRIDQAIAVSITAIGADDNGPAAQERSEAQPVLSLSTTLRTGLPKEFHAPFCSGGRHRETLAYHALGGAFSNSDLRIGCRSNQIRASPVKAPATAAMTA